MTSIREAAEKWLLNRFPDYKRDRSVMHVDVEVFEAGYRAGLEAAAKVGCSGKNRVCCYDCWQTLRALAAGEEN